MKILFLNASPRLNGYTHQTMKCIEDHIESNHTVEWVYVNGLNMKPCISCLKCRPSNECIMLKDDGHRVSRLIKEADALVIGSPTYFGNITGPLRALIDRSLTAFEEIVSSGLEMPIPNHKGKKVAIETTLNAGGYNIVGSIMVSGVAHFMIYHKK